MKVRTLWLCVALALVSLLAVSCQSQTRSGAQSYAERYIRDWAEKQGIEVTAFDIVDGSYSEDEVMPSDRANGATNQVSFTMRYAWRPVGQTEWHDGSALFQYLAKRHGKWEGDGNILW
jgi:hypothetical protein